MIFEVTPEQIEKLSDSDLRILIGYLAEQEADKHDLPASGITYGGHQNAKDDGIDVDVNLNDAEIEGYIPRPLTGFQVKAEKMPKNKILKEMRPNNELRPSIIQLGKNGGAYIIVSSKDSLSKPSLSARRNAMAEAIADQPDASGIHLDFYDQRRLASWVNRHPGLIPWVRSRVGKPLSGWQPFRDWSSSPGPTDEPYLIDDDVRLVGVRLKDSSGLGVVEGIHELRRIVSKPKGAVRLVGLSGVGKTRFVQALFDKDVGENCLNSHLAVYTDLSDKPDPVPLALLEILQDLGRHCILIIDNCGIELHRKLRARMKESECEISLITIEYDISDDEPENTDVFKLEPASSKLIEKVVARRYSRLSGPEASTIAEFSEGNSRVALALAATAEDGESLANLKDKDLFERLFRQKHDDNPALLRAAKACALVYSFDGETLEGDQAELPVLASLAEQSGSEIHGHIAELYRRQLVQKRSKWRAVLPHALAHRLAKQALQDIPTTNLHSHFTQQAPARLMKSFSRRLGCLHDCEEAQAIVADWLTEGGWLSPIEGLNDLGIVIFDNIAPVNPDAVLATIKKAASRDTDFFSLNRPYREKFVSLLRSLSYEPKFFDDCVRLIARFAHAVEESNYTGEAVNVFKSLFYIHLSGTHATVEQRIKQLEILAASDDPRDHALMLTGLDAMLECTHFSSSYSFEFGTRKRDYGYYPRTSKEIQHWYSKVIELCERLVKSDKHRSKVRKKIASDFRFLPSNTGLTDEFIALAEKFASDGGWPEGWAGARSAARSAHKASRPEDEKKLSALAEKLKPNSLADLIASYVAPEQWSALDIAEIDLEDEKRYNKAQKQVEEKCRYIGKELANDLGALKMHLPAISMAKGNRGPIVAEEIGRNASDVDAAWEIIKTECLSAEHEGHLSGFPSWFVAGVAAQNPEKADDLLDAAFGDEQLHPLFVNMQAVHGVNDKGIGRLQNAVKLPTVPIQSFRNLAWGKPCEKMDGKDFSALLLGISEREHGLDVALDILSMKIFTRQSGNEPVGEDEKRIGRELLSKVKFEERKRQEDYELAKLVSGCLCAERDEDVGEELCNALMNGIAKMNVYAWDYPRLVAALADRFPRVVLNVFVENGQFGYQGRRNVFDMFRERQPCPLRNIDADALIEWANEKPDTRFLKLAEVIRPWVKPGDNGIDPDEAEESGGFHWSPVALRLIREAPAPLEMLSIFVNRFRPSTWSGSLATILSNRLPLLETLSKDSDAAIANAAKSAVAELAEEIERVRAWEARHERERDERFEW